MRTQVAIVGGGPSGLLLSQLLHRAGIEAVVLEHRTRAYVLSRIRAGVLEWGLVDMLNEAGAGERMMREGLPHDGTQIADGETMKRLDFVQACGKRVMVYGQTEVTHDLYDAQDAIGATILTEVSDVALHDVTTETPHVSFTHEGRKKRIDCAVIAGCDGFHGVSRSTIPAASRRQFEKVYPFGWLGILSPTPPVSDELIYSRSARGFALASMRNPMLSRYYVQVPVSDRVEDWPDELFWDEFKARMPSDVAARLVTAPSIEKSIAALRSFVCEPMQYGRLFLVGDAAHIVPPTGAKGLNLAASDVFYLFEALQAFFAKGDEGALEGYGPRALARVWQAMRFSWQLTMLLHRFPEHSEYDWRMQQAELAQLFTSETAQRLMAENYTGLPY